METAEGPWIVEAVPYRMRLGPWSNDDQGIEPFGRDTFLPREFPVEVQDDRLPYDLHLTIRVSDRQPRCARLHASERPTGPAVTSEGLRKLPLGKIVRAAVAVAAMVVTRIRDDDGLVRASLESRGRTEGRRQRVRDDLTYVARNRREHTPDFLAEAAEVWRAADPKAGRTKAVAEHYGYSRPHARKLVRELEEEGLIPVRPTTKRMGRK